MKQIDASEIEKIITELDTLLIDGFNRFQVLTKDYHDRAPKPNFNLEEYTEEKLANINEWYPLVYKILNDNFQLKHHLFHFVKPKVPAGLGIVGLPDQIGNLSIRLEHYLYALEDIILRLEELKNLAIRQEIAEKESQADVLYKITYSEYTRLIKINNIVLGKPDFGSENDICFNYLYLNPNRPIPIQELEKANDKTLKKRLSDIVRDLGFTGKFKTVFFPVIEKNKIMFTNPITKPFAQKHDLPALDFSKIGRQMEIKVDKGRNNEK